MVEIVVFDLSDTSIFADNEWVDGQVRLRILISYEGLFYFHVAFSRDNCVFVYI